MHDHPNSEQLDQLRAGLLEDRPEARRELEKHLASCAACRNAYDSWDQLKPAALGPLQDESDLAKDLATARNSALSTGRTRVSAALVPFAATALLILGISVALFSIDRDNGNGVQTVAQQEQVVPDLYEDIDFYLWMADHDNAVNGGST